MSTKEYKKRKPWTKEEDEILKNLVGKISYKEIEKYLDGRNEYMIKHRALKHLNLGGSGFRPKKYTKDENFWETPNPINCTYAGYIAADGYINEENNTINIEISIADIKRLEELKRDTKHTGKIKKRYVSFSSAPDSPKTIAVSLPINSCKKWISDMKRNFNLCQNKTKILKGPNLDNEYLKLCFFLGILDGDGCVCWSHSKNSDYPVIKFTSSSYAIMVWIKELMDKHFKISFSKTTSDAKIGKRKNCFIYSVAGIRAAKIFELLSTFDVPKLERKWNNPIFLGKMEEYKARHPVFFTNEAKITIKEDGSVSCPDFSAICSESLKGANKRIINAAAIYRDAHRKIPLISSDISPVLV